MKFHSKEGAGILIDYCAGVLNPIQKTEVEVHLEQCPDCRVAVTAQAELWETLDCWKPAAVSSNFDARLYARIAAEEAGPAWKRLVRRIFEPAAPPAMWKPLASLGAACAVLTVALALHPVQHKDAGPQMHQMHADSVDIEQVARTLDDLDLLAPANSM